jgi:hypothetical protein
MRPIKVIPDTPGDRFSDLRHCRDRLHSAVVGAPDSIRNDDELR